MQNNVVPEALNATFNIRLDNSKNHEDFETMINRWCKEAGEGVRIEFLHKPPKVQPTILDETNLFWMNFKNASDRLNITLEMGVVPGATDMAYIRRVCK